LKSRRIHAQPGERARGDLREHSLNIGDAVLGAGVIGEPRARRAIPAALLLLGKEFWKNVSMPRGLMPVRT
jgi:hypothetical protein